MSKSGTSLDPYDELSYRCRPIEWTAPERLAAASLLHGGPTPAQDSYRSLEFGCGDGANLLPMAYYRRHSHFTGIDGSAVQIGIACAHMRALDLRNVELIHSGSPKRLGKSPASSTTLSRTGYSHGYFPLRVMRCWSYAPAISVMAGFCILTTTQGPAGTCAAW